MAKRNTYKEDEVLETPFDIRHLMRASVYIKKYLPKMILALGLSALGGIIALFSPRIIRQALDIAILIRKQKREDGSVYRYIDQVCFFLREQEKNKMIMVVSNGKLLSQTLPKGVMQRFKREGIDHPFCCEYLEAYLKERDYVAG